MVIYTVSILYFVYIYIYYYYIILHIYLYILYPPTPALAKAGAAPGTTAGVELVFVGSSLPFASRAICR